MKLSKTSIIAAACLGALALTGVGFAGWYIVSNANETQTGDIIVYEIVNNAIVLSDLKWDNSDTVTPSGDGNIVFGKPQDATAKSTTAWFDFDDVNTERLKPALTMTMTDYGNNSSTTSPTVPSVTATLKFQDNTNETLLQSYYTCSTSASESKTLFTGPQLVNATADASPTYTAAAVTATSNSSTAVSSNPAGLSVKVEQKEKKDDRIEYTVTVEIEFKWGTKFDDKNPYTYYNGLEGGAIPSNIDSAMTDMTTLKGLSGLKYDLTISTGTVDK